MDDLGADFYSGNLHKWLCAPKGSAFLYAAPQVQSLVEPLVVSWGWESEHPSSSRLVDLLEWTGTRDPAAFLAVPDAIAFQHDHDWPAVRARCHQMAVETQRRIQELTGIPPLNGDDTSRFAQMAASPLPDGLEIDTVKTRLYDQYKIEVPLVKWGEKNLIRYSYQAYNSRDDMEKLIAALTGILRD